MVNYKIRQIGQTRACKAYSGAAPGDVLEYDGTKVDAQGDMVYGLLLDEVPTDSPPQILTVYGPGTLFEDDTMDGVAVGKPVYSDGDGTYSVTEPAGVGAKNVIIGFVTEIDTVATDTGCVISIEPQFYETEA